MSEDPWNRYEDWSAARAQRPEGADEPIELAEARGAELISEYVSEWNRLETKRRAELFARSKVLWLIRYWPVEAFCLGCAIIIIGGAILQVTGVVGGP